LRLSAAPGEPDKIYRFTDLPFTDFIYRFTDLPFTDYPYQALHHQFLSVALGCADGGFNYSLFSFR